MSMARLQQIALRSDLSASAFTIAIKLALHENSKTGLCFPSITTLEEESGLSRATVIKSIKEIVKKNIVTKSIDKWDNGNFISNYKFNSPLSNDSSLESKLGGLESKLPPVQKLNQGSLEIKLGVVQKLNPNKEIESEKESGNKFTVNTARESNEQNTVNSPTKLSSMLKNGQPMLRKGFEWLNGLKPYSNPFDEIYNNGIGFIVAKPPSCNDIDGCNLTDQSIKHIEKDLIGSALQLINEKNNLASKKALENRLSYIGKDCFLGEIARMWTEKLSGKGKWEHPGQILIRRLDFCYAYAIATKNFTQFADWNLLWDFAILKNNAA